MLFTYADTIKRHGSDYQIRKALANKALYKIDRGVYSDSAVVDPFASIALRYPDVIFTGTSAYYLHGLSDVIPQKFEVATLRNARKITKQLILQHFVPAERFNCGKMGKQIDGVTVHLYDQERMLLELLHNRNKLSFDVYKEVQTEFRERIDSMNYRKIEQYAQHMPQGRKLLDLIRKEVF
ncbi:MAG: hypothetical protein LBU48_05885 [Coriobacteriales bacterium]|jgi:predicted transcriptional regulator of viral defense system|nr:hypothetical protein [Coriobacteriales bacterium]